MELLGYEFTGPVADVTRVPLDGSGVYVVVDVVDDELHCCLDIGESRQLGDRLKSHERRSCWEESAHGEIGYCYKLTSGAWDRDLEPDPLEFSSEEASLRAGIVSELKWKLEFACGRDPWGAIENYWDIYRGYESEFGPRGSFDLD